MSEVYQPEREHPELLGKTIQSDVGTIVSNLEDSIEVMEHLQAVMVYRSLRPSESDQAASYEGIDNWMVAAATNLGSMYADCCRARALADILARPAGPSEEQPEDSPSPHQ